MKITTFNVQHTFSNDGVINMLSGVEAINQCLKVMILTRRNELFGDPDFGSVLHEKSYNLMNTVLQDIIKDNLTTLITTYDSRIVISNIDISYLDPAVVQIVIDYRVGSETSNLTVNVILED